MTIEAAVATTPDTEIQELRSKLERRARSAPSALVAGGPAAQESKGAPDDDKVALVVDEILAEAKKGVSVQPFAESHPLIPLFAAMQQPVPPEIRVDNELHHYDYHWVELGFSILLDEDQFARRAELGVLIRDAADEGPRQTRAIRVFPDHKDVTLFSADLVSAVGLDAGLNVSVPGGTLVPFATLQGDASLKAKLVFGPVAFGFRRAAVEVTGTRDKDVYWRYGLRSELRGANEFKSILVLKVPAEARRVTLRVGLAVVVCKRRWLFFSEDLPRATATRDLVVELGKP